MNILAHRGLHGQNKHRANSIEALLDACAEGFGIETDIRDFRGELVLSHDPADGKSAQLRDLLLKLKGLKKEQAVALNIKSDGLQFFLKDLFISSEFGKKFLDNIFFFDMSVPSLYQYLDHFEAKNMASRISDIEKEIILYEKVGWIWIDCFKQDWFNTEDMHRYLADGKRLCFVSPELHGRNHMPLWKALNDININTDDVYLCTDMPFHARSFFR